MIPPQRSGARLLQRNHLLQSTGRHPAAGSCRLQGCNARGLQDSTTTSYTFHWALAAVRQPAPAGCWTAARGWLGGSDDTISCTLQAAVRQPAPAGCRAAARGELPDSDYTICCSLRTAVRQPAPAGCRASFQVFPQYLRTLAPVPTSA